MKKPNKKGATAAKIVAGIAATLLMGSNINGCVYGPPLNINGDVYGPPPTDETEEIDGTDSADETGETYGSDVNMNEDVYGPPQGDFYADENEQDCVYGPPAANDE
ncbi:MAG: hypothetical protein K6A80_03910 [Saccharofermentans sp.]|nr:hypothetical protein [Saccharofermentans sp.]